MQTNPPVHCINVENIKMLNNIWKIFLLPSFATNHPPITFTIATLLKYNKEMKHITIKITLIPSVKKVHTQNNTSVAEVPHKSKTFEKSFRLVPVQTIIWFLCKPPSHQCHYAIAFTQTFGSFPLFSCTGICEQFSFRKWNISIFDLQQNIVSHYTIIFSRNSLQSVHNAFFVCRILESH